MMKYFYSIFILLLLSGINYQAYTQNDTISALPYFQSFETADSSWYFTGQPDTINSQSRWGIGSDAALTPDYYPSGKRALICETSIFAELHHAYSPVFNISNLSELRCSFEAFSRQGLGTGPFYFPFEYAIDSDSIWNPINLSNYLFTPWTKINLNLDSLLGGNYIQFRFGSLTLNISYVDNFYLGLQNQVQDLCLNRFVNPNKCLDTLSQAISVEIINKGQNPVSQIELNLRFYGDSVKSETSIVTINPGDTIIHTFSDSINQLSYADDDIEVWIDTISDINTFDNYLVYFDRPTNVTIDTLPYIKSNIDNQYPEWTYSGPGAFNFLTGYFNKQYESPCFDFSNIDYPVLSFKIDATQPFDNIGIITLSYSTDGGNTLNFVDTVIKLESFNGTTANENFVYHFYELGGKENVKFIFHKMNQTLLALSGVTPSNIAVSDYTKNIAPLSIINTNCFTYALSTFFVEIENRGLFDAQNFAVTLHVDTITISDTIPFLAAGDTIIHYVSIGQPMNTPSMKNVTVFTSWVDDMVQNDNTLIQNFHLPGIISQYPYNWTPDSLPEYWHPNQPIVFNHPDYSTTSGLPGIYNMELGGQDEWYFESPCFSFLGISQPAVMMSIKIEKANSNPINPNTAFTFQYSLDDGETWFVVGAQGTGYHWYDTDSFGGFVGTNSESGWSGVFDFTLAGHQLDFLGGESLVRFRFLAGYSGPVESANLYMNSFNIFNDTLTYGCTDTFAINYNYFADIDDGSCDYYGCTDTTAFNYDTLATIDDGSCFVYGDSCNVALDYGFINDTAIMADIANQGSSEVWYSFVLDQDYADVSISLCGSVFDTWLEIYSDCNGTVLYQNDNTLSCINVLSSQIDIPVLLSGNYYARIGENFNLGFLIYQIEITGTPIILGCTDPTAYNYDSLATYNDGSCYDYQEVELFQGWSLISTYIVPFENVLDSIFATVVYDIRLCKDENGSVYWPIFNIDAIGPLQIGKAYLINMQTNHTIGIKGNQVQPELQELTLPAGWSMLGYLRTTPALVDILLSPVVYELAIVKDHFGMVYWPQFGLNIIGNMLPGRGYQISMYSTQSYFYPANDTLLKSTPVLNYNQTNNGINTGNNMTLGLKFNSCFDNKMVSVYNQSGIEIGNGAVHGNFAAISLWGNDELTTFTDGLLPGEEFEIRIENEIIFIDNWEQGNGWYTKDGISLAKNIDMPLQSNVFKVFPVQPNPFKNITHIRFYLPNKEKVLIEIFDISGKKVDEIYSDLLNSGNQSLPYVAKNLRAGTYYFRISTSQNTGTGKMQVLK